MPNYRNINVRSPFFTQKATTGSVVNCEIRLWKGDVVTDLPVDYTYLLSKEPTSGKSTFEVAELARDFLSHTTSLSSGFAWMELKLKDTIVADDTFTFLVSEGYSINTEGLQSTNDTPIYDFVGLPTTTINGVANSSRIMVADGNTNSIPYFSNSDGAIYTVTDYFSDELIAGLATIPLETNSSQMVKSYLITPSISSAYFDFDGNGRNVVVDVLRCSKFDVVNLLYVNKAGFKTKFPFILKSTEKISVDSESFSRSTVDYGALTLNTNSHSSRKRIKDTKQSFVLNSDWIAEYYVSQFEELMLSEYVWLEKGSLTLPVNITTSKLDKKTHLNDKLINYSIEIETASNYINTIR
mgnify:FL=1